MYNSKITTETELNNQISNLGVETPQTLLEEEKIDLCKGCVECTGEEQYDGYCEFCYGETFLGVEVHTCVECGEKTYDWTTFNNTEEDGLFCGDCYATYKIDEDEEE